MSFGMTPNVKALRCWGISERQTNQQQKALLEKQTYNTLTVCPNIVKPLLAAAIFFHSF